MRGTSFHSLYSYLSYLNAAAHSYGAAVSTSRSKGSMNHILVEAALGQYDLHRYYAPAVQRPCPTSYFQPSTFNLQPSDFIVQPSNSIFQLQPSNFKCATGGKLSTRLPPGKLVEQVRQCQELHY